MKSRSLLQHIAVDPRVCFGKPIIRGTRIWVSLILDLLAEGLTSDEILQAYPQLTADDLRAAIAYGAWRAKEPVEASPTSGGQITLRPRAAADDGWISGLIKESWGAEMIFVHGTSYRPATLPAFVALQDDAPVGLLTYYQGRDAWEIVTLDSLIANQGIGTALIAAVKEAAAAAGCRRLWLVTTNDNTHALRFYQKRGFRLVAVHPGAVDAARRLKPQIPLIGDDDIPIHDELELEISPLKPATEGDQAMRNAPGITL